MPRTIEVTDVILRDAHQSLMATRMAFDDMAPALADLDQAGYWSLECWGGATFDSCIRFLNEDPWERLRKFKKALPKTKLQMLLRGQNLLGYRHYGDDVVDRFCAKAAENGMDVFRIFDALNDPRNLERAVAAVKKTGKHAQGTISYTVSPVHTIPAFAQLAKRLREMGCDSICIKDMAALIKPQAAYDLVKAIKDTAGADTKVHLHVHATTGVTLVSLMKAVEAGVDMVDTSLSAMSLGTGHNPTEAFCEMLEGTGYATRIDLDRIGRANEHFAKAKNRYGEFLTQFSGVETSIFKSQIPGGMLSNMESQLKQQGAGARLREVLEEVPRVKADAGHPPLVTPSSQIVGTQAVFNVLMGRYKKMSGEFSDLMLGYYGTTLGEKNAEVVKIAAEQAKKQPITGRPADLIKAEWDELAVKAKALPGCNGSDEDVLTFAMFPQVAPKFFTERAQGPKNVGKEPAAAKPAAAPAAPAPAAAAPAAGPRDYTVSVNGQSFHVTVQSGKVAGVAAAPVAAAPAAPAPAAAPAVPAAAGGEPVKSELAGTVLKLLKAPGAAVAANEPILTIEAMKMETQVVAPRAGTLAAYAVKPGDAVQVGALLATIG